MSKLQHDRNHITVGKTLVVKHAPNVPQCALAFEKLFLDAGAPAGVYANVFLSDEQAAVAIADKRVKGVGMRHNNFPGIKGCSAAASMLLAVPAVTQISNRLTCIWRQIPSR